MNGFKQAQQEWERDNIYFPLDKDLKDLDSDGWEEEDSEVDRRLEDE